MIIINQIKLPVKSNHEALEKKIIKILRIRREDLSSYEIIRRSIDARHKNDIYYVYSVHVFLKSEKKLRKVKDKNVIYDKKSENYNFCVSGNITLDHPPVVIGSGPAGLFLAYQLAVMGYNPILIEQGKPVSKRQEDVEKFWESGELNPYSNVQFGEGGAGTFSDGKLNTSVKDTLSRGKYILDTFVKLGAPGDILYDSKPHIGTDILSTVVSNMSAEIRSLGGKTLFSHCVLDLVTHEKKLIGLKVLDIESNKETIIKTNVAALCIGHSARELFKSLYNQGVHMEQKPFAVGVRVMHSQELINESAYGSKFKNLLPPASYKLTTRSNSGRGVYSFCMCPGGFVVNASSEEGLLAVNGMSYHDRGSDYANSAIVVTVNESDFKSVHPLAGIDFQRELERKAYELGSGAIPMQLFGDFKENIPSVNVKVSTGIKGPYKPTNLRELFPEPLSEAFIQGMDNFELKIKGFGADTAILLAVESRTSSPVRITRDENGESNYKGLYPCGEGAGYAGGIMSAAIDGLKISELIAKKYQV